MRTCGLWPGGRVVIPTRGENAPFSLGPLGRPGPRTEPLADAETVIVEDVDLDAPFTVVLEFARPGVAVAAEFPERFCGSRDTRGGPVARDIVRMVVSHAVPLRRGQAPQLVWRWPVLRRRSWVDEPVH
jgi:hypothetical protein